MTKTGTANGQYNGDYLLRDYQLVFTPDIPATSTTIDIKYQPADWSNDDTHSNVTAGLSLYARACSIRYGTWRGGLGKSGGGNLVIMLDSPTPAAFI